MGQERRRAPLREKISAVLKFGSWFSKRKSSARGDAKAGKKGHASKAGVAKDAKSFERASMIRTVAYDDRAKPSRAAESRKSVSEERRALSGSTSGRRLRSESASSKRSSSVSGARYIFGGSGRRKKLQSSRRGGSSVSGELPRGGAPGKNFSTASGEIRKGSAGSMSRSSSRSLSKIRDQYVSLMLKMADMSSNISGTGLGGGQVDRDSQVFESEIFRRRSQMDDDILGLYLQNSIQPDEWKESQIGSRIIRHSGAL